MPATQKQPLVLNFKEDTLTTVSRPTLKRISGRLGFNETQTVLFALARLRDQVLPPEEEESFKALTPRQHAAIAKAAPAKRGKVIDTLLP